MQGPGIYHFGIDVMLQENIERSGHRAMIFETHAHYDDAAFDADRDALLSAMSGHGIGYIVNVGASIESTKNSIRLAQKYPFVHAAAGIHPSETSGLAETDLEWLGQQCAYDKVVAVGEIGLDYHWDGPSPEIQQQWFIRQLELAKEVRRPVIIHSRDAAKETFDILAAHGDASMGGVIHCFSYSAQMAMSFIGLGYHIGIGGVVTFKNAKKLKEVVSTVPLERILLETDSPYLSPDRGKRNSSLNLPAIARAVADIKGVPYEEVVEVTAENAMKMYRIS